ncbi:MAG: DUF456 domain-containing protein [Phycisphaerae bacterium]|nr:DUF456 domain-containing protein [Phycisphaerae bacterium]MDW8263427.1 DUF456 domain-containing protein [Phycisphaerales bacterium]
MIWFSYAVLLLLHLLALGLTLVSLPGLWLMAGSLALYAWWTGFDRYVGWPSLIAMLALAATAEVVEFFAGAVGSHQAGGTRRGMIGAVVGGIVGAIAATPLIPIPIVGTIAGMCIGSFAGAFLIELWIRRNWEHSAAVGWGAAKGRFFGTLLKLLIGLVMLLVAAVTALPL